MSKRRQQHGESQEYTSYAQKRTKMQCEGEDDQSKVFSHNDYTVGWICAIKTEYVAAQAFLDEEHEGPDIVSPNDNNDYTLGKVGKHNVVIAVLPKGEYGISSAASVARDMLHSFPNVRIGLMVGIGGGAPSRKHDIRLGDIVVSTPHHEKGGVFQYDFGKTIQDQSFWTTGFLNQPPTLLRTAVSGLEAQYERKGHRLEIAINSILEKNPRLQKKYRRPDPNSDKLYQSTFTHPLDDEVDCTVVCNNDLSNLILRPERTKDEDNPAIHYGLIASANQLVKDALVRDKLAIEKDVLCFEMEAAGLMNQFPCLVIRGICDYSDSHKNKEWQGYAAMAAAAYAKDLLCRIPLNKVEAEKRIEDVLSGIQETLVNMSDNVHKLVYVQYYQEHETILEWLTPIDYTLQHRDCLEKRQPGTGQWLLDSAEYLSWLERHHFFSQRLQGDFQQRQDSAAYQSWLKTNKQTLFCPGIPGAGKTITTAIVVNDLYARFQNDPDIGIAYIYCDFELQDEQKPKHLLASLLRQLIPSSSMPNIVKSLYSQHKGKRERVSIHDIRLALFHVVRAYSRTFIIIDALDERQVCYKGREDFLSYLSFLQKEAHSQVNVFATSRPLPDITWHFEEYFEGYLSQEIRAKDDDIHRYIDGQISHHRRPRISKYPDLQQVIRKEVVKAADGQFLLAKLHMDHLLSMSTPGDIEDALKSLPHGIKGLDTMYGQAMERINKQMAGPRALAKKVLSWILHAKRPLTTAELQHAVAIRHGTVELHEKFLPEVEDLVSDCAGLVTISDKSNIVRLVHYTAQQYFERTSWFLDAETDITKNCVTYLSFDVFATGFCATYQEFKSRLQRNPLYDYVARNWGHHARKAAKEAEHLILSLLESEAKVAGASQAMMASTDYANGSPKVLKYMKGIHLAAYFGLTGAIMALLKNGHDPNCKDSNGQTPLWLAACNGREAVVKLLVTKDCVDLNSKDDIYGRTPLWIAIEKRHISVVKLLLMQESIDPNPKDNSGETPLLWATRKGCKSMVELLLVRDDIDPNSRDTKYNRTPLWWAARYRRIEIAKLLLVKDDIDPSSEDAVHGQTPLWWAARHGCDAMVELLLAKESVDPDTKDAQSSRTPLSLAAGYGHKEVVTLLLMKGGVDLNSKDNIYGRTPLLWAAQKGSEAVVEALLAEDSIDLNSKDNDGWTPLWWAVRYKYDGIIKLLLAKDGVDPNSKDYRFGQTLLSWAVKNKRNAATELLLAKDSVDMNAKDNDGRTPLSWAARNGRETAVNLLLEKGAEVESKDNDGWTPLLYAVGNGHETIVKLLLEKGAKLESRDSDGWTPLLYVAAMGHESMVLLLLEKGAELESRDEDGRTPLSWAAQHGQSAVMRLLLEKGAASESMDNYGQTPLSWAARNGHAAIVGPLIAQANCYGAREIAQGRRQI
ncbi:hypothetical protein ACMFMG_007443 [Clarireedia jacksonii]